jgi:hypothetical protein
LSPAPLRSKASRHLVVHAELQPDQEHAQRYLREPLHGAHTNHPSCGRCRVSVRARRRALSARESEMRATASGALAAACACWLWRVRSERHRQPRVRRDVVAQADPHKHERVGLQRPPGRPSSAGPGRGEDPLEAGSPGADVAGMSPVPVQTWQKHVQRRKETVELAGGRDFGAQAGALRADRHTPSSTARYCDCYASHAAVLFPCYAGACVPLPVGTGYPCLKGSRVAVPGFPPASRSARGRRGTAAGRSGGSPVSVRRRPPSPAGRPSRAFM